MEKDDRISEIIKKHAKRAGSRQNLSKSKSRYYLVRKMASGAPVTEDDKQDTEQGGVRSICGFRSRKRKASCRKRRRSRCRKRRRKRGGCRRRRRRRSCGRRRRRRRCRSTEVNEDAGPLPRRAKNSKAYRMKTFLDRKRKPRRFGYPATTVMMPKNLARYLGKKNGLRPPSFMRRRIF